MISLSFVVVALATVSAVNGGPCCPTIRRWPPVIIPPRGGGSGGSTKPKPYIPPRPVVAEISVKNGQTFGTWKDPEFCPFGTYASGFDLKVEKNQGGGLHFGNDDTALNAIALKCKSPETYPDGGRHIKSGQGSWGKWKGLKECHKVRYTSYFLTAFQLRVEKKRGRKDDTAANNINFKCRSLSRSQKYAQNHVIAGAGMGWGSYGEWSANCPIGSAICGLKTRVEGKQRFGDDTALNDVAFYCCQHPVLIRIPYKGVAEDKATTKRTVKVTTIKPTSSGTRSTRRVGVGSVGEIGQRGETGRRGESGQRGEMGRPGEGGSRGQA